MNEKELANVDFMAIKQMRRCGNGIQADALLTAWRENIEKNKKQLLKEIYKRDSAIKHQYKLCSSRCCNKPKFRHGLCTHCFETASRARSRKIQKERTKKKTLTINTIYINDETIRLYSIKSYIVITSNADIINKITL